MPNLPRHAGTSPREIHVRINREPILFPAVIATSAAKSTSAIANVLDGWLLRLGRARFFTVSLIVHAVFGVLLGTTVLFKAISPPPDFVAGSEGLLTETMDSAPPAETPQASIPAFSPATPALPVPSLATVPLLSTRPSSFTVEAPSLSVSGLSARSVAALAALPKTGGSTLASSGTGVGMAGRTGGTNWGMIFGKKVEAGRLGVILDVSASGHRHLAGAIREIEKSFPSFVLVLYPGCGMGETTTKSAHEIRRYTSIAKSELSSDAPEGSTAKQLVRAIQIPEFEQMINRPTLQDKLFVSWFKGGKNTGGGSQTSQTQESFKFLMSRGVDGIYWFADFLDPVHPLIAEDLLKQLQQRRIKLYVHNFAGRPVDPEVTLLANGTGGTINTEKPK